MPQEVITELSALDAALPGWYGIDFAFDTETTGLDYINDRLLGLALTFADDRSYYIVCEHTVPVTEDRVENIERSVPTGDTEQYEHTTKTGKVITKTRPVFRTEVEEIACATTCEASAVKSNQPITMMETAARTTHSTMELMIAFL